MSIIMSLRIQADASRVEQALTSDPARLQGISERSKQAGAIHHAFYASEDGNSVLVVDEWPDKEAFLGFFNNSPDIGEMMGEAGVTSPPTPEFWQELDTPDRF